MRGRDRKTLCWPSLKIPSLSVLLRLVLGKGKRMNCYIIIYQNCIMYHVRSTTFLVPRTYGVLLDYYSYCRVVGTQTTLRNATWAARVENGAKMFDEYTFD